MRVHTEQALQQLEILLNLVKSVNQNSRTGATATMNQIKRESGYTSSGECVHRAELLVREHRRTVVKFIFSYVEDQCRLGPAGVRFRTQARVRGAFFVWPECGAQGWKLVGDY